MCAETVEEQLSQEKCSCDSKCISLNSFISLVNQVCHLHVVQEFRLEQKSDNNQVTRVSVNTLYAAGTNSYTVSLFSGEKKDSVFLMQ